MWFGSIFHAVVHAVTHPAETFRKIKAVVKKATGCIANLSKVTTNLTFILQLL
jgi:hypothetical protein